MNRRTLVAGLVLGALVAPPSALAKGPISATISGPGGGDGSGGGGISIGGDGEGGNSTPLGRLVESAGFFPAAFGQTPDPTSAQRPAGDLGPKYVIRYRVPGPNNDEATIVQDVYPYAERGAVTYTKPGQPFFTTERTHGGWFTGGDELQQVLVDSGLPASAPSGGSDSGFSLETPWTLVTGIALALMAAAGLALVRRRQAAPAR